MQGHVWSHDPHLSSMCTDRCIQSALIAASCVLWPVSLLEAFKPPKKKGIIFFLGTLYWSHLLSQCTLIVTSFWITDGQKQIFRNLSVQFKLQYQTQITWTGQKSAPAWWMMVASTISGAVTTLILHNITRATLCKDNVWLNCHATNSSVQTLETLPLNFIFLAVNRSYVALFWRPVLCPSLILTRSPIIWTLHRRPPASIIGKKSTMEVM